MPHRTKALVIVVTIAVAAFALPGQVAGASSSVSLEPLLTGLSRPVLVTYAPGSPRVIFIVEQTGRIKRAELRDGQWRTRGTFLNLSSKVNDPNAANNNERGLLGLAFHPNYQQNGLFYVNYTRAGRGEAEGDTVIAEYRRQGSSRADPSSRRVLMTINQPAANHNGGHLLFGPDGYLYIGLGDGGGAGDEFGTGQRLSTFLAKLLRIDPLDPDGQGPDRYSVPSSNPFVGKSGLDEIWAWGLRNPWRFSFDRATGDLWIGDVGQSAREEIDRSRANEGGINAGRGINYGWSRCEGKRQYPATDRPCRFGTRPVHDYGHGTGVCAVTGGHVHRGPTSKSWRGLYVAGDFCGRLFVLDSSGKVRLSMNSGLNLSSFGEDAAGRIFATDLNGTIYGVRFRGPRP